MTRTRWILIGCVAALVVAFGLGAAGGRGILYQAIFHNTATGGADRTAYSKLADIVSVKDFGAVGDGVTAEDTAFAAAIAALSSGGTLIVPAGSYKLTSTLTINQSINISGTGYGSRIFGDPGNNPLLTIAAANVTLTDLRLSNTHTQAGADASFHVIKITKAASNVHVLRSTLDQGRAISNVGASGVWVEENAFSGMTDFGVTSGCDADLVTCPSHVYIRRNRFSGGVTSGVSGPPHDVNLEDTSYAEVAFNDVNDGTGFTESGASCIKASVNHAATVEKVQFHDNFCLKSASVGVIDGIAFSNGGVGTLRDSSIFHNTIEGYNACVRVAWTSAGAAFGVKIAENLIRNCQNYGIITTGDNTVVSDVSVEKNQIAGPGNVSGPQQGIYIQQAKGFSITGNRVHDCALDGIWLENSLNGVVTGNSSTDNGRFAAGDGIHTHLTTNTVIAGNTSGDDQGSPTQVYGFNCSGGSGGPLLLGPNIMWGNLTAAVNNACGSVFTAALNSDGTGVLTATALAASTLDTIDGTLKAATINRSTNGSMSICTSATCTGSLSLGTSLSTSTLTGATVNLGTSGTSQVNLRGSIATSSNVIAQSTATMALDAKLGAVAAVTLTANVTTVTLSNFAVGQFYTITFIQGGAGSFTVTGWPANVKWLPTAYRGTTHTAPTLTTAVGARDSLFFRFDGTNLLQVAENLNN